MNWKKTLIACLIILVLAIGVTTVIFLTEPTAVRSDPTKRTAMLVDVVPAERGTYEPVIEVMGAVVPEQEISLSPRISGEVISVSETFTPGGFAEAGEVLLVIDPADYEAALLERESALRQAMADLEMEIGRQEVAKKDYELLNEELSSERRSLVLRQPQLNTAQARVEAARAALRRAELDLERTRIRAPFAAHIISREVNVGSQVSPGAEIGHLVGVQAYWVEAAVPVSKLGWILIPGSDAETGSVAKVRNRAARQGAFREGTVHRLIGSLESQTRMARVLIEVKDPLSREAGNSGKPPLMIGSYVETHITGKPIEDVIRISRDHLRKNDTVWVMEDDQLRIREVDIVFRDKDHAYIREGLADGDRIVTTNLSTVVDGAGLRLEGEAE